MIKDAVGRSHVESIRAKRKELAKEKSDIIKRLRSLGLTATQKSNRSSTVSDEIWQLRDIYVEKLSELDSELSELNAKFKEIHSVVDANENKIVRVLFREIFSEDQIASIWDEVRNRADGGEPIPVGLNFKDLNRYKEGFYSYREALREILNERIEFRIMLTGLIEKGCEQFGNADFLKFISPLNKMVIPVAELEKIKKKFLL